jgi:tetraprenyl-beta-curcumene synthase
MPVAERHGAWSGTRSRIVAALGDRQLALRTTAALALANARYWSTVAPLANAQLCCWTERARQIQDPLLREAALANLREEGFNAQATATLATLAPREHRAAAVKAIVALQILYDYLDTLVERPLPDQLPDARRLYDAFVDAVAIDREPRAAYYPGGDSQPQDSDYLRQLVATVRAALARLPSQTVVAPTATDAAERCAEAQARAHATRTLGNRQLQTWAAHHAQDSGLQWQEYLTGAVSSGLALHALTAAAAIPDTTRAQAHALDATYLSICALTTLLDGLIDYDQDLRAMGHVGYIRYYSDTDALADALKRTIQRARAEARKLPDEPHHLMTLAGVAAYYATAPTAANEHAAPIIRHATDELRPLITPTLLVMRAWRLAKRVRGRARPRGRR